MKVEPASNSNLQGTISDSIQSISEQPDRLGFAKSASVSNISQKKGKKIYIFTDSDSYFGPYHILDVKHWSAFRLVQVVHSLFKMSFQNVFSKKDV